MVSIPTDGETGDVEDQVGISSSPGIQPAEPTENLDAASRARYLAEVMADIDAEVKRRRASGDLPAGLERELDELFLEFSPVGMQGKARLRETLALVDGAAYVDIAVPVLSNKAVGVYIKRLIRKSTSWYMGFVVHQITRFAWSVSRMLHLVVDHVEDLEATVDSMRAPELPESAVPLLDAGASWWAPAAIDAVRGSGGRVLHVECGSGTLVEALVGAGIDAYGVDPSEPTVEPGIERGLDVRAESVFDHLQVVSEEALGAIILSGSVQWLHANDRQRLVRLASSRLAVGGVLVLQSMTPEAWQRSAPSLVTDLAPGRPLHAATWSHLLAGHGVQSATVHTGGDDRRLEPVPGSAPDAAALNAVIEVVNELALGPTEYVLVAARER
ncbi:MAG TPA: methionine biosynthesis protein MetW [Acidimicrobiales bacterium]|nr:methionine biosynthesis protein MetW [Acidimicrobiales bacterium]